MSIGTSKKDLDKSLNELEKETGKSLAKLFAWSIAFGISLSKVFKHFGNACCQSTSLEIGREISKVIPDDEEK